MDELHPLLRAGNIASQPQDGTEGSIEAYKTKRASRGTIPYITNAINGLSRGATQVVETPYNIVNRAPQLVNLLPGEQGVGTLDEMADNTTGAIGDVAQTLFPSKDPLINAVAEHYPHMDQIGGINNPNPNYPRTNRFSEDVGMGVATLGASGPLSALKTVGSAPVRAVGKYADDLFNLVKAGPKRAIAAEVAASGGAAAGREIADQNDLGPVASFFAEFLGGMGPSASTVALPPIAKAALGRKGGMESLEAMQRQGIRPSIGATGNRAAAGLESGASSLPGFSVIPERVRDAQMDQFGSRVRETASDLRPDGATSQVDDALLGGQLNDIAEGGINRLNEGFSVREEALTEAIGASTPVNTQSVRKAILKEIDTGDVKIKNALEKELGELDQLADEAGNVPYESFRKWRSNFGADTEGAGVLKGAKNQVYAGVTEDLQRAADGAGVGDDFTTLMNEQRLARADVNKSDVSLAEGGDIKELSKLKGGELKAKPYVQKMLASPENFDVIQRNATPEQVSQLRGDIVEYLGLATKGAQDAAGEVISPNQFLTNWNKIDPRVKNMLFDDDLGTRQTLDDLALIAEDFKRRGLEANASRTAGTGQAAMALSGIGKKVGATVRTPAAVGAGYAANAAGLGPTAVGAAGAAGITYGTVKGLMSETLARWAAGQTPEVAATMLPRVPGNVYRASTEEIDERE